jgi:hypothetical protein
LAAATTTRAGWLSPTSTPYFSCRSSILGALSGVGIVHPAALASFVRDFVWGWAIERVVFIVEMAAALLYARS